jgi:hypothetical protein
VPQDPFFEGLRFQNLGQMSAGSPLAKSIGEFRVKVWVDFCHQMGGAAKAKGAALQLWLEDLDFSQTNRTEHFGCFWRDRLVGATRLSLHADALALQYRARVVTGGCPLRYPVAMFSRTVVDPEFERLGIASHFDLMRLHFVKFTKARTVYSAATARRVSPLKRIGFRVHEQFLEDDATFYDMDISLMYRYMRDANELG